MKTINIAPTWLWVGRMYIFSLDTDSSKAIKGFRAELRRLGARAAVLMKTIELHNRTQDKQEFLRLCRDADGDFRKGE